MKLFSISTSQLTVAALGLWLTIGACSKETVQAPYPYNELKTFQVVAGVGDTIPAAISNGSIILYWPFDHPLPESIAPLIAVSEHAVVSPASGTKVSLKDSVSYVVTAETGAKATYKLRVVVNQPDLLINDRTDVVGRLEATTDIGGITYVIPDSAFTAVYLVSATGTATRCVINSFTELGANEYSVNIATPAVDTGSYKLKIVSGAQTVTSERDYVQIIYPFPTVNSLTAAFTLKRGGTFTLNGANMRGMVAGRARLTGGQTYYNLELVAFDLTSVTYRIPADFPPGNYNLLHAAFRNYLGATVYLRAGTINPVLIITE
ncbi:efflux RND transporter periplasmic adaptor subunit [Chitinophaga ginsengisoli]|uniref:DUF5018 domain-containing protein n=1 Tax=Chitinophaga ginsengisoli TaxID=363837 RepID=A0A2P8GHG4_9BACT|nr:hypothetical protein [Chitinophaga ginsengisoli]PSL33414.1 hypothetical protein CLV42_103397 [Chitinophaga ginsengisoli]